MKTYNNKVMSKTRAESNRKYTSKQSLYAF
nr:MAG TPA: hypothetical protein [Caudoviricetes sp.]